MKAWICNDWGDPQSLVLGEMPTPLPGKRQVLIDVHCSGVNFPDTLMIAGKDQMKAERPFVPGVVCAGTVMGFGDEVTGFKLGDRVTAILYHGGYAQHALADDIQTHLIPDAMCFDDAAAFPTTYGTVYRALVDRGRLRAGETLLVLGAAGGVGLNAVELGRLLGANVIAAAGTDAKLALARSYGAQHTINYTHESIRERVKEITAGNGADVVFDPVGGDAFDEALRCMAREGRLLVVGFASGRIPSAPANRVLMSESEVIGVLYGGKRTPQVARANFAKMIGWYLEGKLKPHVSMRFPFDQVPAAMNALLDRSATGKVLVTRA
ncbi:MAG: NADPH:quinone oxidoreductase family protein [Burkholderiaceae bacterium]|nr:NADPH:quinone oxidoreductase family protein [Burkholderiaceae bacterium]